MLYYNIGQLRTVVWWGASDKQHMQGKQPVVFVVCNEEYKEENAQIILELKNLCNSELPEYSQPAEFYILEKMPLTSIGKIDYRALEEMVE